MKKILVVLMCFFIAISCFSACIQSSAARAVQEKITAIGEVSLDKENLITEAEAAYTALSEKEKLSVEFKTLELARKNLETLKDFNIKVQNVLGIYETALTEYGTAKSVIVDSYNALSAELSDCPENLRTEFEKIFEPVRVKNGEYEKIETDAAVSAKVYIDYFRGINTDKTITVTDIGCIAQVSEGTVYYLFAFTYTDGRNEETLYSTVRFAGTPAKESFKAFEKNFYADAPSSENADALTMGNIEILPGAVN